MEKQPAKINYFFKDGYIEFGRTIRETFSRCSSVIHRCWYSVTDNFDELKDNLLGVIGIEDAIENFFEAIAHAFLLGFSLGRLILSTILTPIICVLISIVQIIVLLIFMIIFYIAFVVIAFLDWSYRKIKRISTSCPRCGEKYSLPAFVCTCGAKHTFLAPSRYGALTRICTCGRKLKTTFFNGRHKQAGKWICPTCGYELNGPLQIDIPIPVIGGPSSGKTCFINMAISQLEKNANSEYGLVFKYKPNVSLGDDYESNKNNMKNGLAPRKTSDFRLKYYQFYLTPRGEKIKNLISICDVAGEVYDNIIEMRSQIGYRNAEAYLMLIDPLSILKYRNEIKDKIDIRKYGASNKPLDETISSLITTLNSMHALSSKNEIKTSIAVVFTKCDIPGLNNQIGPDAVRRHRQKYNIRNIFDATNEVCQQFLRKYDEENFLNILESKFKSIQFFTCSALGHVENGNAFVSEGVEEPVLWLIDKASASINLKKKWGKKI